MVQLSARRALVAALVLLVCGLAAGTAVAHDDTSHWWKTHHGHRHGHGGGTDTGDGAATSTTTASATTPTATTPATTAATTDTMPAPPPAPPAPAAPPATAAAPQLGRSVALAAASGTVLVRAPGGATTKLTAVQAALPTGTHVDTRRGTVALTSAIDAAGTTQTGRFSGGVFAVRQSGTWTQLVLVGGAWKRCAAPATASAAYVGARAIAAATKKKKPIRRLWGSDDHGRFQTRGSGSVATVRGTRWLTEDTCAGTRTTVTQGAVAVRALRTGKTVTVTAGHSLLARR
ncbi:hypothetical protein DSM104299_01253 [Baekduia alba]|uniref:hypothetical protein n=1 Tax=Baekduia alba TaxID=2997333 RepID=UPI0023411C6D|nr:hypothetical protein [Baekduia alba]WCB92557.1 hypothetical protein DSM104299_01253 [Baekduia alba]